MTTVQDHIKELLFEQDCVVIPDFGGFVTNFDSAKIDASKRFIVPPQKWLAFNALLKNDDGLLCNYIAKEENISREQATQKIKSFVEETKRYLQVDEVYQMGALGMFSMNDERKIQFQPKPTNNFYSDSFGMENIFLKKNDQVQKELQIVHTPVVSTSTIQKVFVADREPMAEVLEDEEVLNEYPRKRFSKVLPYVYGIIGATLLASAVYLYDNPKANLSSLNPLQSSDVSIIKSNESTKKVAPAVIENKAVEPKAEKFVETAPSTVQPKQEETIIAAEKRFFLITGSFGNRQNAKKLLNQLKQKGFEDASLIFPKRNEKLIKVSAGGFFNESEADSQAAIVSEAIKQPTWVYKK
jgi:cell division septation protein DedD/nucleoid DNA-binding protein